LDHFPIHQKTNPESARATIDRSIDRRPRVRVATRARVHVARVSSDDGRGKTTRTVLRVETREHTRRERWEIAEHRARDARGGG